MIKSKKYYCSLSDSTIDITYYNWSGERGYEGQTPMVGYKILITGRFTWLGDYNTEEHAPFCQMMDLLWDEKMPVWAFLDWMEEHRHN